jgi:aspartate carbamoyltransferase
LEELFDTATTFRRMVHLHGRTDVCTNTVASICFFEPSTRTRISFTAAILRLGAGYVDFDEHMSSSKKGETIEDTVRALECYSDVMVMRHPKAGMPAFASQFVKIPVINAGDGAGEHPTQSMLDMFTIKDELGLKSLKDFSSIEVTLLGDLKHGRTVHSLLRLLARFRMRINLVSPEQLKMPEEYITEARQMGAELHETRDLDSVIKRSDVLYVTRVQQERFPSMAEYEKLKGAFIVSPSTLASAKKSLVVMHPLPRVDEITPEVDSDPRAAYFRQMENGLYVRMGLLASVLGRI